MTYTFGPVLESRDLCRYDAFKLAEDIMVPIRKKALELRLAPKPVDQLSEEEKFAICFAAGVAITSSFRDGRIIFQTAAQCGIVLDRDRYQVYVRELEKPV